jgi:hypothetical protein
MVLSLCRPSSARLPFCLRNRKEGEREKSLALYPLATGLSLITVFTSLTICTFLLLAWLFANCWFDVQYYFKRGPTASTFSVQISWTVAGYKVESATSTTFATSNSMK